MQEREVFLDKLRVAATCVVVLHHTITGVMDHEDMSLFPFEMKVFLALLDLICWSVPVFLLISGYLFLNPDRKTSMRDMLTKYCRRILLALFLFGVPYACMEQIALEHTFRLGMLGNGFLMVLRGESWAHMWYLYLIFLLYLMTPAAKWQLERIPLPAVYVLSGVLVIISSILPWLAAILEWKYPTDMADGFVYLFFYLCGYLFAVSGSMGVRAGKAAQDRERNTAGKRLKGCGGGASAWILSGTAAVLVLGMAAFRLSGSYTARTSYNHPFAVMLALLLFGAGLVWSRSGRKSTQNTGFWKRTAALTFAVYLIHPVFLNFFYKFLHITPLDFNIFVSLPLFYLGTLLLSFAAAWAMCRIPALRKYVL